MKKGFTLAEVLITLAILGVVAAVTLPNMVQDTKYQQLGVELSKFASTLENAATAYAVGLGGNIQSNNGTINDEVKEFAASTFLTDDGNSFTVASDYTPKNIKGGHSIVIWDTSFLPDSVDTNIVGVGAFDITFKPNIKGINKTFVFTVTTKGYVYPSSTDSCIKDIYDNNWKVTPSMFKTGGKCVY